MKLGDQPADLRAMVGTFDEKHSCWVVVRSLNGKDVEFPTYAPMADIQFPSKTSGDLPVRQRYLLNDTCCACIFKEDIQAPPEAGPGTAKVTFSFNMWKEGHVAPSTVEIPVISADQARHEEEAAKASEKKPDEQK